MWYTRAMRPVVTSFVPRRSHGLLLTCLAVLVALAGLGAWLGLRILRQSSAFPAPVAVMPLAADKSYGVTADLSRLSPAERDANSTGRPGMMWSLRQHSTACKSSPC